MKDHNEERCLLWAECLCMPAPDSSVKILTPKVMGAGGKALES